MGQKARVAHLTSAHPRYDTRIFHKICASLIAGGYSVALIVADGLGDELKNSVDIFDVGKPYGRIDRIRNATKRVLKRAVSLNADVYHLHDPELIPIGVKLKNLGKRVVFDSHEDVPTQMLAKPYLGKPALWVISKVFEKYEAWACEKLDGVIAATPFIRDKFVPINHNTVDINNFPLLDELTSIATHGGKPSEICYVGHIAKIRGILEAVQALARVKTPVKMNLCGEFDEHSVREAAKAMPGWECVNEYGFSSRDTIREVLSRSVAGLVALHPIPNYLDAQPVKMFEYMSAGIPVIASDFRLWREIIDTNSCGLLVDPLCPQQIAEAIDYLVANPRDAQEMGRNGRRAVVDKYNWQLEEAKLLAFYKKILNTQQS